MMPLAGLALALAAGAFFLFRAQPAAPVPAPEPVRAEASRAGEAVPDVSRSIFRRRAVPVRSDKPLRLRAGPSGDAPQVAVIGPDQVFRVAPRQGEWWPARLSNGAEGYVSHRFVDVLDAEPLPDAGRRPPPSRRAAR